MKILKPILAAAYLSLGVIVFTSLAPISLFIFGLMQTSNGIGFSTKDGVHILTFKSEPGNLILIAHATTSGDKAISFIEEKNGARGGSAIFAWENPWFNLLFTFIFVLLSTPILRRLLTQQKTIEPGGPTNPLPPSAPRDR